MYVRLYKKYVDRTKICYDAVDWNSYEAITLDHRYNYNYVQRNSEAY